MFSSPDWRLGVGRGARGRVGAGSGGAARGEEPRLERCGGS